ncbi:MAG: hypothetical protein KA152_11715, partial [Verrucomicrobiales bacterium]|nr:hypothetical protein [Verrucomicrobiales bacterium]
IEVIAGGENGGVRLGHDCSRWHVHWNISSPARDSFSSSPALYDRKSWPPGDSLLLSLYVVIA